MLAHLHVTLAQRAGCDRLFLRGYQIGRREVAKQLAVDVLHRFCRVQRLCAFGPSVSLLQRQLGVNVRHGQALLGGQRCVCGKVLAQGLVYLVRAGVLALNAVGVIRVHAAQQAAQLGRHAGAGKGGGQARQVMRLGQQGLHAGIGGQQRFELVDLGVHSAILPT